MGSQRIATQLELPAERRQFRPEAADMAGFARLPRLLCKGRHGVRWPGEQTGRDDRDDRARHEDRGGDRFCRPIIYRRVSRSGWHRLPPFVFERYDMSGLTPSRSKGVSLRIYR